MLSFRGKKSFRGKGTKAYFALIDLMCPHSIVEHPCWYTVRCCVLICVMARVLRPGFREVVLLEEFSSLQQSGVWYYLSCIMQIDYDLDSGFASLSVEWCHTV